MAPNLTQRQGIIIGLLTGLIAGILGFLLSFAGLAGMQGAMNQLGQVMSPEDLEGMQDIPAWGGLVFNLIGVAFNIAFGAIGGLIGGTLFRTDKKVEQQSPVA